MAAKRHVNPDQLAMFIPAHELVDSGKYDSVDLGKGVRAPDWQHKLDEAHSLQRAEKYGNSQPLVESVRKTGIERPINLGLYNRNYPPEIGNGHHRIISAYAIDPKSEVPVIHHDVNGKNWRRHADGGMNSRVDDDDYEREHPY